MGLPLHAVLASAPAFSGCGEERRPVNAAAHAAGRMRAPGGKLHDTRIEARIGGVGFTHPQRILLHEPDITKAELARYYDSVGETLLAHLRGRPLALLRQTGHGEAEAFFQRHLAPPLPAGVVAMPVDDEPPLTGVESVEGVLALVQLGMIELHTWGARHPLLNIPDRLVIDLDPDSDVSWPALVRAARDTRSVIEALHLPAFVKTTGGKGLHIVIPVKPSRPWSELHAFAHALAARIAALDPGLYTLSPSKSRRTGKIYIDVQRNARAATTVAAYSVRARPGAPVSMPIEWDQLGEHEDLRFDRFNLRNTTRWIDDRPSDPWSGYGRARRALTVQMFNALGLGAVLRRGSRGSNHQGG